MCSAFFLSDDLWRDTSDPEEMALPAASDFKVLHLPIYELQLCSCCCFLCRCQKAPLPPFPSPVDLVDKFVWEPMEALNQQDGAAGNLS